MDQLKPKMSEEKKAKLVYSGELIIIALLFLVLGILRLTGLMGYNDTRRFIFNILTTLGGVYGLYNLISYIVSKKKRAKTSLVDIVTTTPIFLFLLAFDIYCYINVFGLKPEEITESFKTLFRFSVGGVFTYAGLVFIFQGIYHYFKPIPLLYQMIEEDKKENEAKEDNNNGEERN